MQVIFLYKTSNRQRNEEYKQYEAMKAYYESRGDEVPYKTLAGFRRARRREEKSAKYKAWKYRKADEKQFKSWIEIVGKQNMPETLDEFRDIKYNESTKFKNLEFSVFQKNTQKLLNTKEYPIVLHSDAQGKHIKGHKNFKKEKDPSYFIEGKEDEITKKLILLCGTGEMQRIEKRMG